MDWKRYEIKTLNILIESKKTIITKKEICQKIGMTENGLHKAIQKGSLRFDTFQDICEIINVDPCDIFKHGNELEGTSERKVRDEKEISDMRREVDMLKDLIIIALKERKKE